ncbi:MAG TPA: DUF2723 domain-containing protein [Chloroflexota bacterium]|nr:DUF2723 domain-containing protein [Chloroflexota bacterium]
MRVPILVLVGGLALYLVSMAPTVLWGDDAELQRIVITGEQRTIGQSGEASHLLWLWTARAFVLATSSLPLDAAGRTNLVSALFGTVTLPFAYGAAAELARGYTTRWRAAGLAAAAALALSHTFWLFSARPDAYSLQTALLTCAAWALLRWRRSGGVWALGVAAAAVLGALLNHVMILASGFGLAGLALTAPRERRRELSFAILLALVGGAAALLAAGAAGVPLGDLAGAVLRYRATPPSLRELASVPAYLLYQFPLSIALAAVGLVWLARRDSGLLAGIGLLYLGNAALVLGRLASVRDDFVFLLPSYVPVALLAGLGAAAALPRLGTLAVAGIVAAPVVVYPTASATAGALAARFTSARQLPGRDPVGYYLLPPKTGYLGARRFADSAFAVLERDAVLVSDWLPYQPLRYAQAVEGARPDVRLEMINAGNGAQLTFLTDQQRRTVPPPLYLADASPMPYYELDEIWRCFAITPQPPVYRLEWTGAC